MSAQQDAQRVQATIDALALANARSDYYVSLPGRNLPEGPMSERQMRDLVNDVVAAGRKPLVLKVVEDYGK